MYYYAKDVPEGWLFYMESSPDLWQKEDSDLFYFLSDGSRNRHPYPERLDTRRVTSIGELISKDVKQGVPFVVQTDGGVFGPYRWNGRNAERWTGSLWVWTSVSKTCLATLNHKVLDDARFLDATNSSTTIPEPVAPAGESIMSKLIKDLTVVAEQNRLGAQDRLFNDLTCEITQFVTSQVSEIGLNVDHPLVQEVITALVPVAMRAFQSPY